MIKEYSVDEIRDYTKHLSNPQFEMVLSSITDGNTEAQFWMASQSKNNSIILTWDKGNNVFYILGDAVSDHTTKEFVSILDNQVRKKAIEDGLLYFKVHSLSKSGEDLIENLFHEFTLTKTNKLFYTFRKSKPPMLIPKVENIQFMLIDESFLKQDFVQNLQYVRSEIQWMWPSLEKFYRNGFGFVALIEKRIICWCTAEYVSTKKCGIGIETIPELRNNGIASSTVAHFVDYCQLNNITPYWECDRDNIASNLVAENVGFEKMQETTFWAGTFENKNHI